LVNALSLSTPQKWKDQSVKDIHFWLCIFGLCTIKRGCSMKSWGEIILAQIIFHPFAMCWSELWRIIDVWNFLGRDSGTQDRRLRAFQAGDFGPEPETLARESGHPNSIFDWVVLASIAGPESLETQSGDSGVVPLGGRRLWLLQAGDFRWHRRLRPLQAGDFGVSRFQRLERGV
jgi:hypothetical protein